MLQMYRNVSFLLLMVVILSVSTPIPWAAAADDEEELQAYVDQRAREQWAIQQSGDDVDAVVQEMVGELLIDGFNVDNPSLAYELAHDVAGDYIDAYYALEDAVTTIRDGDLSSLAQDVVARSVDYLKDAAYLSDVEDAVGESMEVAEAAGAFVEGDYDASKQMLLDSLGEHSSFVGAMNTARQRIQTRINNWTNDEIEEAYQVYRDGAERHGWIGSYSVDAGGFDAVWSQMDGAARQIKIDAQEEYRRVHGYERIEDIPDNIRDNLRQQARESLQAEFELRREQEDDVQRLQQQNQRVIEMLQEYNMLETWQPWHNRDQTTERLLDRLYDHIDQVMEDTGRSTLIYSQEDLAAEDLRGEYYRELTDDDLVLEDVVGLVHLRLSDGHDAYFEELEKRGLIESEHIHAAELEGRWRGSIRLLHVE